MKIKLNFKCWSTRTSMYLISWYKTNIKKSFWSLETVILPLWPPHLSHRSPFPDPLKPLKEFRRQILGLYVSLCTIFTRAPHTRFLKECAEGKFRIWGACNHFGHPLYRSLNIQASKNAAESIFWHFWNHFSIKIVIFASFSSKKKVFFC